MADVMTSAFGLGALILLPGFFAATLLRSARGDLVTALVEAWSAGFSLLSILALLLYLAGAGVNTLLGVSIVATIGMGILVRRRVPQRWTLEIPRGRGSAALLVIAIAVASAWVQERPLSAYRDDGAHLAEIDAVARTGEIFPAATFHAPGEVPGPDPRFGSVHTIYGVTSRIVGASPESIWNAARLLAGALLWLTFFELAFAVFGRTGPALYSTLIAMLSLGGIRFSVGAVAMYPIWIGMSGAWLVCARWLDRVAGRDSSRVELLVFAGAPIIHFFPWLLTSVLGATLLLVRACTRAVSLPFHSSRYAMALVLGTLAVLCARLAISYGSENPIHQESWNILRVGGPFIMFQPAAVLQALSLPGLLAPFAWWFLRDRGPSSHSVVWAFIGATTLIPFVFPLNPLVTSPLHPFLGFLIYRLSLGSLHPLVWGALMFWTLKKVGRLGGALTVISTTVLLLLVLRPGPTETSPNTPVFDDPVRSALQQIASTLPNDAVVLSDPYTMLGFSAFTPTFVVAVPDGRSSPRDARASERLISATLAYSPDSIEALRALPGQHFGASHLVIHDWQRPLRGYMVDLDRDDYGRIAAAYQRDGATEITGNWPPQWRVFFLGEPQLADPSPLSVSFAARPVDCTVGHSTALEPGATVTVTTSWQIGPEPLESGVPRVYLRLDRHPLSGSDRTGGKVVRKLRERWTGEVERFRSSVTPSLAQVLLGAQSGSLVTTQHRFTIPPSMRPGQYDVQLKWVVDQRSHEESLSGLLRNQDGYSGDTIARIEISQ